MGVKENEIKSVPGVGNYYGGILIAKHQGQYYWLIENYDTDIFDLEYWHECPDGLYHELAKISKPL